MFSDEEIGSLGRLSPSPLGPVAAQLGFPDDADSLSSKRGLTLQKTLRETFPDFGILSPVQESTLSFQVGQGGISSAGNPLKKGWRTSSLDGVWNVTLLPESLTLECTAYPGWQLGFSEHWRAAVDAVKRVVEPTLETRLALRYFNALTSPEALTAGYWVEKIKPAFLGVLLDGELAANLTTSLCRAQLAFGDGEQASITMNFRPDIVHIGAVAAVFDIEVGRVNVREFSLDSINAATESFRVRANWLFRRILSEEYFKTIHAGDFE